MTHTMLQLTELDIHGGQEAAFETTFLEAEALLRGARGYLRHSLRRGVETPSRYLLLVQWRHLEDHTVHFREAPEHITWKALLSPFYARTPKSVHFELAGNATEIWV